MSTTWPKLATNLCTQCPCVHKCPHKRLHLVTKIRLKSKSVCIFLQAQAQALHQFQAQRMRNMPQMDGVPGSTIPHMSYANGSLPAVSAAALHPAPSVTPVHKASQPTEPPTTAPPAPESTSRAAKASQAINMLIADVLQKFPNLQRYLAAFICYYLYSIPR